MLRPNLFTKLMEWIARLTVPKQPSLYSLGSNYANALSKIVDGEADTRYSDPLVREVFEGVDDEFIYKLSELSDTDPRIVYPGWADAVKGIPTKLSPMYLMRTEWVLWYDTGKVEIVELPRTGGWDEHGNYTNYPKHTLISMPLGVVKAAKVGSGGSEEPTGASGLRWMLYVV